MSVLKAGTRVRPIGPPPGLEHSPTDEWEGEYEVTNVGYAGKHTVFMRRLEAPNYQYWTFFSRIVPVHQDDPNVEVEWTYE